MQPQPLTHLCPISCMGLMAWLSTYLQLYMQRDARPTFMHLSCEQQTCCPQRCECLLNLWPGVIKVCRKHHTQAKQLNVCCCQISQAISSRETSVSDSMWNCCNDAMQGILNADALSPVRLHAWSDRSEGTAGLLYEWQLHAHRSTIACSCRA